MAFGGESLGSSHEGQRADGQMTRSSIEADPLAGIA
jgi:hypothetical protein